MLSGVPQEWPGLNIDAYHGLDCESSTTLRKFERDRPAFFQERIQGLREPHGYRKDFAIGSAVHAMVLEDGAGLTISEHSTRSNAFAEQFENAAPGEVVVPKDVYELSSKICKSVLSNPVSRMLLRGPGVENEKSFLWKDRTGIRLKVRYDAINPRTGIAVDLKTAGRAKPPQFREEYSRLRYDIQCGLYMTAAGLRNLASRYYYVVVSTEEPFDVFVYEVCGNDLRHCLATVRSVIDELFVGLGRTHDLDWWMSPWRSINPLSEFPEWRMNE